MNLLLNYSKINSEWFSIRIFELFTYRMNFRNTIFILLILISQFSLAQNQTARPAGNAISSGQIPTISLIGQVIDANTKKPVPYATVSIFSIRENKIVEGNAADDKGFFKITGLKPGKVIATVAFIGYANKKSDTILLNPRNPEVSLGLIKLVSTSQQLKEATVTSERGMLQMSIDKKVFNVDKNILSVGGSANDVLQTIPAVDVDINGNLSLRGSGNVTVLIDGRPSTLTGADRAAVLDQIPANTIESVELITNPSAKYDPDGTSGIINIILKKNKQISFSGSVNISASAGNRYNGGLNLNYRNSKWNFATGYSFRSNRMKMRSLNERDNFIGDTTFYFDQIGFNRNKMMANVIRFSLDHYLNDRNTIGFSSTLSKNNRSSIGTSNNLYFNEGKILTNSFTRTNDGSEDNLTIDLGLNYRRTYIKPKKELVTEITYSATDNNSITDYLNSNIDTSTGTPFYLTQNTNNDGIVQIAAFKLDFTNPIDELSKVEFGFKTSMRNNDADFIVKDNSTGIWSDNLNQSNHFVFTEMIYAAYANYARTFGKWGAQAGLRIEQANTVADQRTNNIKVDNNYLSLFPSIYLSRKLNKDQEMQLNYSRRINRPQVNNLNPFTDFSDPQNLRTGNPNLKPEYIDSYEMSYIKYWKKNSLTSTLYFRQTNDQVQRYRTVDSTGVSTVTFQNLSFSRNFGFEFIAVTELMKNWTLTSNLNLFRNEINVNSASSQVRSGSNGSIKLISSTKIPKWFDLQLSGNYNSAGVTAQGEFKEVYSADLGLKRDVLKNKGSVTLSLSDIFNTREMRFDSYGDTFSQYTRFKRDSQILTVGFTYRFGKSDFQKNKRGNREDGPGSGMDDMMF